MSAASIAASRAAALAEAIRSRVVVADGATGSLLDAMLGDEGADRRDLVPIEKPEAAIGIHRAYIAAGADIIKTATFNASARGLSGLAPAGEAPELAKRVNAASATFARSAADEAEDADGRMRWVAGSVGPGSDAPSLGGCSYRELRESYLPQFLGLIRGGADLALIETVQDALQCKAAIGALEEAGRLSGRKLPFIASATVDARGRLLSGADPAAFAAIVEPFGPLAIGLNCSGGPDELEAAFAALSRASGAPVCIMPNAGLPRSVGGKVSWPLDALTFAEKTAAIAKRYGAGIAGGCCGTGPDHVAALAAALAGARAPAPRPRRIFALASAFEAVTASEGQDGRAAMLVIDERSNASGSAAFKAIVKSGDSGAAARFVADRAAKGPAAVDISVAGAARDEAAVLSAIVSRAAPVAGAAFSIDTTDPAVLEAALPLVGGRPLVNSVNLEDRDKAARAFSLAREYGAAVVCLAVDARGPARDRETKLEVCKELYALALAAGLSPQDLLFDTCTFPTASGDRALASSAAETIAAVAGLPAACPGSGSVLGVGNSSFGLPKALRPAFTSRFAAAAREAGLSAAIVDPAALSATLPEGLAEAADAVIDARGGIEGYGDAVDRLLAFAPALSGAAGTAAGTAGTAGKPESSDQAVPAAGTMEALSAAIASGDSGGATAAVASLVGGTAPADIAAAVATVIAGAMAELGKRYDAGELALPRVLRSADAARDAFAALRAAPGRAHPAGPVVVLSTVKGDLHDIGKNLVGMVLEAAGFDVLDLGTDRNAADIASAAAEAGALAVGVSGLLTRSLSEMERVAAVLAEAGSGAMLLCGGAAVDGDYVAERIEPRRPGLVAFARDPFEAAALLETLRKAPRGCATCAPASAARSRGAERPATSTESSGAPVAAPVAAPSAKGNARCSAVVEEPAFVPPFTGSAELAPVPFDRLVDALEVHAVVRSRWGYKDEAEGRAALDEAVASLRAWGGVQAACRYGFYRARKTGPESVEYSDGSGKAVSFGFPREAGEDGRSVADYYADDDAAAAFCVTLGKRASDYLAGLKASGDSAAYLRGHGLLAGLAEAAAELAHRLIAEKLTGRGACPEGKRYSFGFPGCPDVEYNAALLGLLAADGIGLRTTSGHQLDPEFSVTAIIIQRAAARYIRA